MVQPVAHPRVTIDVCVRATDSILDVLKLAEAIANKAGLAASRTYVLESFDQDMSEYQEDSLCPHFTIEGVIAGGFV